MASFINNIIIGIEGEEEHDEIVNKVVKKIGREQFICEAGEIQIEGKGSGVFGVVIGLEGIKMEEEKVKDILDWLTLKGVQNIQKFLGLANYYH